MLDALDKRANAIARDSHRVYHVSPLIDAEIRHDRESNREVNREAVFTSELYPSAIQTPASR